MKTVDQMIEDQERRFAKYKDPKTDRSALLKELSQSRTKEFMHALLSELEEEK